MRESGVVGRPVGVYVLCLLLNRQSPYPVVEAPVGFMTGQPLWSFKWKFTLRT